MRARKWFIGVVLGVFLYAAGFFFTLSEYPEGTDVPTWVVVGMFAAIAIFFGSLFALLATGVRDIFRKGA